MKTEEEIRNKLEHVTEVIKECQAQMTILKHKGKEDTRIFKICVDRYNICCPQKNILEWVLLIF